MSENKLALPGAARGKTTWSMDPEEVRIPPPGHFLHDPESPTVASPSAVRRMSQRRFGVITVTKIDGEVFVLLGRERTLAAREVNRLRREAGQPTLPIACEYLPCPSPIEAVLLMVNENRGRRKVTAVADARYAAMLKAQGLDAKLIAQEFECSEATVRNMLALGEQPDFVLKAVSAGEVSAGVAKKFTGTASDRLSALDKAKTKGVAGSGKGRRKDMKAFTKTAAELGVKLDAETWKKLLSAWKAL